MASGEPMDGLEAPSAEERTIAMLAHLLMAFTGFIGPVVILALKAGFALRVSVACYQFSLRANWNCRASKAAAG